MSTSDIPHFHPLLQAWFSQSFGEPTDVQRQSWAAITAGKHTLIAAPTGSGKTLAALLPCVNASLSKPDSRENSRKGVETLYITPLKALNNDIQHHVVGFGEQLEAAAEKLGIPWPGYRSAVRTGDTTPAQRRSMLKNPPQLLITTPESLFILLTSEQGRGILRFVKQVIIDEIHDLAGDKRGSHLSLSLERLTSLTGSRIQRIGVSATQKPLSAVAAFLGGWMDPGSAEAAGSSQGEEAARSHSLGFIPRPVHIVESNMDKKLDVTLCMPQLAGIQTSREAVWGPLLKTMFSLMEGRRSVLVFVNSRRLCERLVLRINDFAGMDMARSHHGSMSKELRLEAEARLKSGDLRCLVATSSLELGIDVGHIDLVIQIDSPLSAASGIQRIGRAGHAVGDTSAGVIIPRYRGALPEAAVLGKCIAERDIDPIVIPERPIDVLSQQTIAIAGSAESVLNVDELHRLVAGSDSYRELDRVMLEEILNVLAGFYPFSRPILDWNRESGEIAKRGNTAIAALRGAGTIPQSSQYPVHHIDSRTHLGELDEEFVLESRVGDVFLLGTNSWMIRQIEKDRVYVSESANSFSEIPFWRNEGPGRSFRLGKQIGAFMETLSDMLRLDSRSNRERGAHWSQLAELSQLVPDEAARKQTYDFLRGPYGMDDGSATELMSYVSSQHAVSELPTSKTIVVEHYRDMMNQTHVVVLNHFGRRINRTWLLALQRQFELLLPYTLYGNAKDNGIEFVLPEWDSSWLRVFREVMPGNVEQLLMDGMTGSPLLAIAFRRIAETGLLLARSFTRTPMWQMRLRSEELLRDSLPYADKFPFLAEAMRECMHDYLDLQGLKEVLTGIQEGDMTLLITETAYPSPMATQFLADYVNMKVYEGDGLNLETQASLLAISRELAGTLFGPEAVKGVLSPSAILEEENRLLHPSHTPNSAAGLLELLKQHGESSLKELSEIAGPKTREWVMELIHQNAIAELTSGNGIVRWYCAEEETMYKSLDAKPEAAAFVLNRYVEGVMSFSSDDLTERYPILTTARAEEWIQSLSKQGRIVPTPFQTGRNKESWSGSRIVERLIKTSLREARSQVQPVNPWRWCGLLAERQHVGQGNAVGGSLSIVETLRKLQGLYMPVSHWESLIFPARIPNYRKEELDMLCSAGELIWLGEKGEGRKEGKIAFFLSDQAGLFAPIVERASRNQTAHPELLELLKTGGAAFLTGLSRNYGKPPSETLSDLLELVWEGHASNDQFAPLRVKRGKNGDLAQGGSGFGRWYWTGSLAASAPSKQPQGAEADSNGSKRTKELAESALGWLHQLLEGYGIITKELIHAVSPFSWDDMLPLLGKLEEWGTVVRGRFIEGQSGMQFAPPGIASRLTEAAKANGELTILSALDPANPFGLMMDWPDTPGITCARKTGSYLVVGDGKWRYWIENNGKRIYNMEEDYGKNSDDTHQLRKVFSTILHTQRLTKIVIDKWNNKPVAESEAADLLQSIGAERDGKSYVLWMSRLQARS
ncbi:DEAD/DEAH box helicase [Paenibacillus sp. CAU 1782]